MSKETPYQRDHFGIGGANPGLEHKLIIYQSFSKGPLFFDGTGLDDFSIFGTYQGLETTTYNFIVTSGNLS